MTESSFIGTGWTFPPAFDNANHQLQLSSGEGNIKQSIDLLLQTPTGSRSLMPDYGCNLFSYVFRRIDATVQEEIVQAVKMTLLRYEPRINVENVDIFLTSDKNGVTVNIDIDYTICQTNTRHNHVFPFSQLEGTNLQTGLLKANI